jgi:hypothetical protein
VTSTDVFERCRELRALERALIVMNELRTRPGSASEWLDVARVLEQRVRDLCYELGCADPRLVLGARALLTMDVSTRAVAATAPRPDPGDDAVLVMSPWSRAVH